jgi:hypothetical protein
MVSVSGKEIRSPKSSRRVHICINLPLFEPRLVRMVIQMKSAEVDYSTM